MKEKVKHISIRYLITLVMTTGFLYSTAQQTEWTVSNPTQLATAITAANAASQAANGVGRWIINVNPGTYAITSGYDAPTYRLRPGISIVGGSPQPVFNYTGTGCIFLIENMPGDTVFIKNLIMQNPGAGGWVNGGGIRAVGANAKLIVDNCNMSTKAGNGGGAMYVANGAFVQVNNSNFYNCNGQHGGVFRVSNATLHINNSKMYNNTSQLGGVFYIENNGNVKVMNSEIYDNVVSGGAQGGAAYLIGSSTIELIHTIIARNTSSNGGSGFHLQGYNTLILRFCTMVGNNNVGWAAGGISAGDPCTIIIENSIVSGNNTTGPLGDDLPPNVNIDIENSFVGEDYVVSNDPDADCQPNCVYEGVLDLDSIHIGDSGSVTIHIPTEVDTDSGTITLPIPKDPEGNPTIGAGGDDDQGQSQATLRLTVFDSIMCAGDSTIFTLRLNNHSGSALYRLFEIDSNGTHILLASQSSGAGGVTFSIKPTAFVLAQYIATADEGQGGNNQLFTSNQVFILIVPRPAVDKIDHSQNVAPPEN